jgi:hypothetical protein
VLARGWKNYLILKVMYVFPLLATCLKLVSCLAYSSTLKMEAIVAEKHRLTFTGLHDVMSPEVTDSQRGLVTRASSPGTGCQINTSTLSLPAIESFYRLPISQ